MKPIDEAAATRPAFARAKSEETVKPPASHARRTTSMSLGPSASDFVFAVERARELEELPGTD
jgi:hypothetical protein